MSHQARKEGGSILDGNAGSGLHGTQHAQGLLRRPACLPSSAWLLSGADRPLRCDESAADHWTTDRHAKLSIDDFGPQVEVQLSPKKPLVSDVTAVLSELAKAARSALVGGGHLLDQRGIAA